MTVMSITAASNMKIDTLTMNLILDDNRGLRNWMILLIRKLVKKSVNKLMIELRKWIPNTLLEEGGGGEEEENN